MHDNNKFLVRRTDSQERFEILWEKRLTGEPTLKELAEMDEIINRDPLVQEFVLRELEKEALPMQNGGSDATPPPVSLLKKLSDKVRSFLGRFVSFCTREQKLAVS